jgi:hypothetical protein
VWEQHLGLLRVYYTAGRARVCATALRDPDDEGEASSVFVVDAEEMTVMYKLHPEDLAVTALSGFVSPRDGEARVVVGTVDGRVLVRGTLVLCE